MDTILTCQHCAAKLKIKTAMLKLMKEVRCSKCRHLIPVAPSAETSAQGEHAAEPAVPKSAAKTAGLPVISFACPKCARKIGVLRVLAGKKVKCPGCAEVCVVPADGSEPAPPPSTDAAASAVPARASAPAAVEQPLPSSVPSAPAGSSVVPPPPEPRLASVSREAEQMAAVKTQIGSLSELVHRLQDDLARERSEIAGFAAQVETLKNRLAAIEQKG